MCGVTTAVVAVALFSFVLVQTIVSALRGSLYGVAVFGGFAVLFFLMYGGLFQGLLDVAFVRTRRMDVIVEENAAGIGGGGERWYLFLDGVTKLHRYRSDVWTIEHFNGTVLHVPTSAITEEQLDHIRAARERGRTPAGVRAVVERGRRIEQLRRQPGGGEA